MKKKNRHKPSVTPGIKTKKIGRIPDTGMSNSWGGERYTMTAAEKEILTTCKESDIDLVLRNSVEASVVARAMISFGGSFVQRIGHALQHADDDNTGRIKTAFPEYWQGYLEYARITSQ